MEHAWQLWWAASAGASLLASCSSPTPSRWHQGLTTMRPCHTRPCPALATLYSIIMVSLYDTADAQGPTVHAASLSVGLRAG